MHNLCGFILSWSVVFEIDDDHSDDDHSDDDNNNNEFC